jgi:pilus assembly protein CpaB
MQVTASRRAVGAAFPATASNRKSLLVALVLGLVAALLSWLYVQRVSQESRQATLVPVIVAASDIPVRTQVTSQMLTVKQVAADARHEKAFTGVEQVQSKVTNLPITAGEQVLSTKFFARKEDSGLAFRIPPGRRAVSVNVNEVVSSGGMIMPGDHVDVVSVFSASGGATGPNAGEQAQDTATIVLQNMEVLAVAQQLNGPVEAPKSGIAGSIGGTKTELSVQPNARTVTLAVTPEEAQKLILAEEKGKIRLALRAVEDNEVQAVPATRLSAVKGS